jgi:predicted amidohydrolase
MICDPLGQRVAVATDDTADEVVHANISRETILDVRDRIPLNDCRRADVFAATDAALAKGTQS